MLYVDGSWGTSGRSWASYQEMLDDKVCMPWEIRAVGTAIDNLCGASTPVDLSGID